MSSSTSPVGGTQSVQSAQLRQPMSSPLPPPSEPLSPASMRDLAAALLVSSHICAYSVFQSGNFSSIYM